MLIIARVRPGPATSCGALPSKRTDLSLTRPHPRLCAPMHAAAQKAVAIVKSWPLFPDMCSISTVALQKRRPELLAAEAQLPQLAGAAAPKLLTAGEAAPAASAGSA